MENSGQIKPEQNKINNNTTTKKIASVVKIKFKYKFKLQSIGKVTYGTETQTLLSDNQTCALCRCLD